MANVSKYILSKRMARGGMAEIFLGLSIEPDGREQICAIKRILPHFAGEREYLEMFRSEAGICKRLIHPNIVRVYDFRSVDGHYALIMEFVNGTDLRTLLAACEKSRFRLSVPMCIHLALSVARGLHYAHSKVDDQSGQPMGIVHRDISPQNILVSYEGEVKIIDFGIANFEAKNLETKPGVVKGKYSYMSPEQVVAKRLDARSDIFSLSIILWEALGMKRLFAADTEVETIANVQNCLIKYNLKDLNKNVDDDLMRIITKGLEKDRKYRYATAQAMEKDLQQYLETRHPDFKYADLGEFLKQILAVKRIEIQQDIKKLVSGGKSSNSPAKVDAQDENQTKVKPIVPFKKPPVGSDKSPVVSSFTGSAAPKLLPTSSPSSSSSPVANELALPPARKSTTKTQQKVAIHAQRKLYMQRMRYLKQLQLRRRSQNNFIGILAGLLLTFCIVVGYHQWRGKFNRAPIPLTLKASTPSVIVNLDGKTLFSGTYVRTPAQLSVAPGVHKLTVARLGYETVNVKIKVPNGVASHEEQIELKPLASANFANVRFEDSAGKNIYVDVNRGLYWGKTPLSGSDLDALGKHVVTVYPNYPKKTGSFKCNFELGTARKTKPVVLTIFRADGKKTARCSLSEP